MVLWQLTNVISATLKHPHRRGVWAAYSLLFASVHSVRVDVLTTVKNGINVFTDRTRSAFSSDQNKKAVKYVQNELQYGLWLAGMSIVAN